jgi:hypothetical protein
MKDYDRIAEKSGNLIREALNLDATWRALESRAVKDFGPAPLTSGIGNAGNAHPNTIATLRELTQARNALIDESLRIWTAARRQTATWRRMRDIISTSLPVGYDVETVTYHRPPTASEARFGEGATHYLDVDVDEIINPGTRQLPAWFIGRDGLRYYK